MKDNNDILSKRIRERLKDFEQPVSDHVWPAIEDDLAPTISISRTKTLWRRLSVAASFLLVLSLGTLFFLNQNDKEPKIVESKVEKQVDKSGQVLLAEQNIQDNIQEKIEPKTVECPRRYGSLKKNLQKIETLEIKTQEPDSKADPKKNSEIAETKSEREKDQPAKQDKKSSSFYEDAKANDNLLIASSGIRKKGQGISYSLSIGNGINSIAENGADFYNNGAQQSPAINYSGPLMSVNLIEKAFVNNNPTSPADYTYDIPISVGFSVRKYFSESFALESGLVYTYLSSEGKVVANVPVTNNINLNYLGIPLKAVYSVYNNKRISVYASAGGMVEKSVYGEFRSSTNNKVESEKLNIKELQWSVAGSVGINFQLVGHLGLFVEPGVAYYFDDGSKVMTIRKDQPFNFNLQGGLRLTY